MQSDIDAASVARFHDRQLRERDWPMLSHAQPTTRLWQAIDANHRYNGLLWREEERMRRADLQHAQLQHAGLQHACLRHAGLQHADLRLADIAAGKRLVERYQQRRSDAAEAIDEALLAELAGVALRAGARLSSETAGAMIDRLSILSLQIHHMRAQAASTDASGAQVPACAATRERFLVQRQDLSSCLDALLQDALAGRAHFKLYQQCRMDGGHALRPDLGRQAQGAGRRAP